MHKYFKFSAIALLAIATFTACDDSTEPIVDPVTPPETAYKGTIAYVVNQGNMYNKLPGSIDQLNLISGSVASGYFYKVNGQYLGDTPQAPVRYGQKIYVPMYGSNCLWIIDAQSMKQLAQVSVSHPEAVVGSNGYVFVASNDGYVERVDTATFVKDTQQIEVGPNPAAFTALNEKVYVTVSDGYNYMGDNAYQNGKKVVAINAKTFTKDAQYTVGINPGLISAGSTDLFVVARGNYTDIASTVQKIDLSTGKVSDVCEGSLIAMQNDTLYVLNIGYDENYNPVVSTRWIDVINNTSGTNFIESNSLPVNPIAININPVDGHIFICSRASTSSTAYSENGIVYEYSNLKSGAKLVHTYNVGVEPYGVVFN